MSYWDDKYSEETVVVKILKFLKDLLPRILSYFIYLLHDLLRFLVDTFRGIRR
ncbi:hypothetical protein HYW54_05615 [Candidatus Gottesmanbacteria bacterium]|nr:hypothetical protein [Candidatus Gottesmanbacteria bacterium]